MNACVCGHESSRGRGYWGVGGEGVCVLMSLRTVIVVVEKKERVCDFAIGKYPCVRVCLCEEWREKS